MMNFLINAGADPKLPSIVSRSEQETILEVSVRWSHVQIVRNLLARCSWNKHEILAAYAHVRDDSDNSEIRQMLMNYSK